MPFTFLIVGIVLVVSGVRGTSDDLYELLQGEFTGHPNFLNWLLAILVIGSLGYIDKIRTVSRAFLVLIIVVLFLSNKGFFDQFMKQIYEPSGSGGSQ